MLRLALTATLAALIGAGAALVLSDRAPDAVASAPGATSQGVAVRGTWSIEVRTPDGTLVERRQFRNAFQDLDNALTKILSGTASPGYLSIRLLGSPMPCALPSGTERPCSLLPPGASTTLSASTVFDNLETTRDGNTITLKGHAIAGQDGNVSSVFTSLTTCPPTVTPADCGAGTTPDGDSSFTAHQLASPIAVLEDQQVIAEVELQFSNAQ